MTNNSIVAQYISEIYFYYNNLYIIPDFVIALMMSLMAAIGEQQTVNWILFFGFGFIGLPLTIYTVLFTSIQGPGTQISNGIAGWVIISLMAIAVKGYNYEKQIEKVKN